MAAGLIELDPHDLKHAFVTWNLAAGERAKWVADQMGHESAPITADIYYHLLPETHDDAASRVES